MRCLVGLVWFPLVLGLIWRVLLVSVLLIVVVLSLVPSIVPSSLIIVVPSTLIIIVPPPLVGVISPSLVTVIPPSLVRVVPPSLVGAILPPLIKIAPLAIVASLLLITLVGAIVVSISSCQGIIFLEVQAIIGVMEVARANSAHSLGDQLLTLLWLRRWRLLLVKLKLLKNICHLSQCLGKGGGLTTSRNFIYSSWMVVSLSSGLGGLSQIGNCHASSTVLYFVKELLLEAFKRILSCGFIP